MGVRKYLSTSIAVSLLQHLLKRPKRIAVLDPPGIDGDLGADRQYLRMMRYKLLLKIFVDFVPHDDLNARGDRDKSHAILWNHQEVGSSLDYKRSDTFPSEKSYISGITIMASNMASKILQLQGKVVQLQGKAAEASKLLAKQGCTYYNQLLEQNKQYVQHPPDVEKCNTLAKQLFYTRLASIPVRYETFWQEVDQLKHLVKNMNGLKVEHYGLAALFGVECLAWFWGGEIVGRGFTLTGYYV
ncbi:hypothetical protein Dimus_027604 [Dionaea muscipula]